MNKLDMPYKYLFASLFLGIAILILWQMLLPGYVLLLDMVFGPEMHASVAPDTFVNSLPVRLLIEFTSSLIPAWVIQKIIFLALFFVTGYLAFLYLPIYKDTGIRLFAALLYVANPFVYARFLAGHWTHLIAYGLLPLFVHALFGFTKEPSVRSAFKLAIVLVLIGMFSIHFLVMALLIAIGWILCKGGWRALKYVLVAGAIFLLLSSYWIIPALSREQPIEQRFSQAHWEAFAAASHKYEVPVWLNVLTLNGFWGERELWAYYFAWPQEYKVFWIACILLALLILFGIWVGLRKKKWRATTLFLVSMGGAAFVLAFGAGDTPFHNFNIWLYEHVPFWSGFRDSQKFVGVMALSYISLAGMGAAALMEILKAKKPRLLAFMYGLLFFIPICMGLLVWGGFQKQLKPVWYPQSWHEVKRMLEADTTDHKILVLPWHGYMSFHFANNAIIWNPARRFFGEKIIQSKSIEVQGLYDQEQDPAYHQLDVAITRKVPYTSEEIVKLFERSQIAYILYFQDLKLSDRLSYPFLGSERLTQIYDSETVKLYRLK